MHVLMVSEYFPPRAMGGGELSAFALAKALVKRHVKVSVLTSHFGGDTREETRDGIKIYRLLKTGNDSGSLKGNLERRKFTASVKRALPALVKRIKPSIVHAMNITSMPGVASLKGIPLIAHINSPLAFCPKGTLLYQGKERTEPYTFGSFVKAYVSGEELGRMGNAWYLRYNPLAWAAIYSRWVRIRNSFPKFNHFLPISTAMQRWLEKYGVGKKRSTVVPNIINLDAFQDAKAQEHGIPRLLYLGGYVHMKGLHVVLDALQGVQLPYELHCYGTGSEKNALQELAWKNGVSAVFHDEVSQKELPSIMASSDILAFPSLVPEAFGRVALEAMAAGKPVVASDIGGITDIVVDGKTGLLPDAGDAAQWRNALVRLLDDAKLRKQMGSSGRKRAQARFAEKKIVDTVIKAYRKVAE